MAQGLLVSERELCASSIGRLENNTPVKFTGPYNEFRLSHKAPVSSCQNNLCSTLASDSTVLTLHAGRRLLGFVIAETTARYNLGEKWGYFRHKALSVTKPLFQERSSKCFIRLPAARGERCACLPGISRFFEQVFRSILTSRPLKTAERAEKPHLVKTPRVSHLCSEPIVGCSPAAI